LVEVRTATILLLMCVAAWVCGCESGEREAQLLKEVGALKLENQELASKLAESEAEAGRLEKQVKTLEELGPEVRAEGLYRLEAVKITRYTGLYEKEGKEKLIVYLQPIDESGDVIKAAGQVDVQLWDLNRAAGEALLGEWHVSAEELKELWFDTLLSRNYRLVFDVDKKIAEYERPLTVKVNFIDYLSGKTFSEQRAIER
jgi:hypothetical protein